MDDLEQHLRRVTAVQLDERRTAANVASLRRAAALPRVTAAPPKVSRWRPFLVAGVAVAVAVPGVAVAAESTVPGDALFPVKRGIEQVRSVLDPSVVARHRLDELRTLLDREAPLTVVEAALVEAERATATVGDVTLQARLDALRRRVEARREPSPVEDREPVGPGSPPVDGPAADRTDRRDAAGEDDLDRDADDDRGGERDRDDDDDDGVDHDAGDDHDEADEGPDGDEAEQDLDDEDDGDAAEGVDDADDRDEPDPDADDAAANDDDEVATAEVKPDPDADDEADADDDPDDGEDDD